MGVFCLPNDLGFYVLHAGRCLTKGRLVSSYGLQPGATFDIIFRGLGGGGQAESRFPEGSSAHTTPEERGAGVAEGTSLHCDCHEWIGHAGL